MTDRPSNTGDQSGGQLFKNMDETERIYAPQSVPGSNIPPTEQDVDGTAGTNATFTNEPPAAGPVAPIASNPTGSAATPNIGHDEHGGAAGDPETQAAYPIGDDRNLHHGEPRTTD